jgi:hypothetical protein
MEDTTTRCVLIPCSTDEHWAVPQNCLAEITTVNADSEEPPETIDWRGREVPVIDFGAGCETPWSERRVGTGLVAIFLGLAGEGCEYWGVALRGNALAVANLAPDTVSDAPDRAVEHASGAFEYEGVLYQVPDLDGLQKKLAAARQTA